MNILLVEYCKVSKIITLHHGEELSCSDTTEINIHELAHKCKEWAKGNDYSINSGNRLDGTKRYDVVCTHKGHSIVHLQTKNTKNQILYCQGNILVLIHPESNPD